MRERRYRDYDVRTRSPPLPRLRNRERDYSPPPPRRSRHEYSPPPGRGGGYYHDEGYNIRPHRRSRYAMDSSPSREKSRRGSDMAMSRELPPRVYRHRERSPRPGSDSRADEPSPREWLVPSNSSLITEIKRQMMELGDDVDGGRDGSLDNRHVGLNDGYGTGGSRDKVIHSRAEGPSFYGDFSLSEAKPTIEASRIGPERLYQETEIFDNRSIPVPAYVGNRDRGRVLPELDAGAAKKFDYTERTYPLHSINLGREKHLSFRNPPGGGRESYIEESKSNIHLEKDSSYVRMSNHLKAHVPDSLTHSRDGYHRLPGGASPLAREAFSSFKASVAGSIDHGKYAEMPPHRPYAEERMLPEDHLRGRRANLSPADDVVVGHKYSAELQNKRIHGGGQLSTFPYEEMESIREKYGIRDPVGSKFAYHSLERIDHHERSQRELISGSRGHGLDCGHSLPEPSHSTGQEQVLSLTSSRLGYGIKIDLDEDELKIREARSSERDVGRLPYEDTLRNIRLSKHELGLHKPAWSPGQRLATENGYSRGGAFIHIKHEMGQEERIYDIEGDTSHGKISSSKILDFNGDEELMDIGTDGLGSYSYISPSTKTDPTKRELKQRLGSCPGSVKKRLGPRVVQRPLPWLKNQIFIKEVSDNGGYHDDGDKFSKPVEPSEDSEEFKQLVDHAFLKYFKLLNENSAKRKKYTERVGSDSLKCSVCGSDSKDFTDSLGLVMHAFMTRRSGLRIEHLGLHRALCVLLGWSSAAGPDGIWSRQILIDAEASAVKEDLIIWPPVVILHQAVNPAQYGREAINGKEIEGFLREKGFISPKTRVRNGSPTNRSILAVSCQGTLSGLLEAERLHTFYLESKHGRTQFVQIDSNKARANRSAGKAPADDILSSVYGYLGMAEDLDKLDSETKRKSVVRSKKKIQNLAEAQV